MSATTISRSSTMDKYLEAIYRLEEKKGSARTGQIAERLKLAPGTVAGYIEYLKKYDLVFHEPYRGVKLTDKGRRMALDLIRKHRLSERLMTDILRMDWSIAHFEASLFQQGLKNDILKPLEKALGHPKTCPHGNPIPTKCGAIVEEESEPLTNLNPNQAGIVVKITDEKSDLLRHLSALGIRPNTHVKVEGKILLDELITLRVDGKNRILNNATASVIWVKAHNGS